MSSTIFLLIELYPDVLKIVEEWKQKCIVDPVLTTKDGCDFSVFYTY